MCGSSTTTFSVNERTITYSNGRMSITETTDNRGLLFDVNTSPLQPLLSSTNKLSSDFVNVNGISLTKCFPLYQPLISNYNNNKSIKLMIGINLKHISVANSTTTYTIPGNSTLYSNGIMNITESANSNIIVDVDISSLQTKTIIIK